MQHAHQGVAERLRAEIEGAPRHALPEVGRRLWSAVADGTITEADAEVLGALLARRTAPSSGRKTADNLPFERPRPARPRPTESIQRRRRWAAAGYLPPKLAASFTVGEQAVLGVVALEVGKRGSCTLTIGHVAAVAGVSETTVRRAIRQARLLGMIRVKERRISRFRNDSNVLTIESEAWLAWLKIGQGVGAKSARARSSFIDGEERRKPSGTKFRLGGVVKRHRDGPARQGGAACLI